MKIQFHTKSSSVDKSTDTIIEAKSAWQNFLKGKMGKGKSLKELSVEFKKLKAEGKLDDEGNVVEASNLTRNGLNKKKSKNVSLMIGYNTGMSLKSKIDDNAADDYLRRIAEENRI
jgi:hypothetical protein